MLNQLDYCKLFHEIKNSVTLIGSSLQLLEKKYPDIHKVDYWNTSMEEITYLRNLLVELSQNRVGDCGHLVLTDLRPLLEDVVRNVRFFSESSDFQCILTMPSSLPLVNADAIKLKQALINLLKNSYESMNCTGKVILGVSCSDQELSIEVTDFGSGVPAEYATNLFDCFVTSKPNGTGLGLAITKEIILAHNGTLSYHNNSGQGCTFLINLPIIKK